MRLIAEADSHDMAGGDRRAGTSGRGGTTRFGPLTTAIGHCDHEISRSDHEVSTWDVRIWHAKALPKRLLPVSVSPLRRRRFWGSRWGVQLSHKGVPR